MSKLIPIVIEVLYFFSCESNPLIFYLLFRHSSVYLKQNSSLMEAFRLEKQIAGSCQGKGREL